MIRNCWYALGYSSEFERGRMQGHTIAGRPIVSWRATDGEVVALDARCSHKRFPLWDGKLLEGDVLECGYHGFAYDKTGKCVAIPALHEQDDRIPKTAFQRKYPVVECDNFVWIWPGDETQAEGISPPETPELGSRGWETRNSEVVEVAANSRLLLENLFDLTHFYPLHAATIGTREDARIPVEIVRDMKSGGRRFKTIRRRTSFRLGPMRRERFGLEIADQTQEHEFVSPGLVRVVIRVAPPGRLGTADEQDYVLYQTITPIDEERHLWRRSTACRRGSVWASRPEIPLVDAITAGAPAVVEEDRRAVEQQWRMFAFPDEGYREVHIKTDGAVVMLRRILDELEDMEDQPSPAPGEALPLAALRSQPSRAAGHV